MGRYREEIRWGIEERKRRTQRRIEEIVGLTERKIQRADKGKETEQATMEGDRGETEGDSWRCRAEERERQTEEIIRETQNREESERENRERKHGEETDVKNWGRQRGRDRVRDTDREKERTILHIHPEGVDPVSLWPALLLFFKGENIGYFCNIWKVFAKSQNKLLKKLPQNVKAIILMVAAKLSLKI